MAQNNKKKTANSSQSSNKRTASSASKNKSTSQRSVNNKNTKKQGLFDNATAQKQVISCVLFALALFLACIIIIPSGSAAGESNVWQSIKDGFFGIFGISACTVPPLLFFLSYVLAKDKPIKSYALKLIFIGFGVICLSAFLHIARFDSDYLKSYTLSDQVAAAWEEGFKFYNFGILGAFFGGLLAGLCGKVGSIVTLLILLFVTVMVLTGTSMSRLFEIITALFSTVRDFVQNKVEERKANAKEREKKSLTSKYRRPEMQDIYSDESDDEEEMVEHKPEEVIVKNTQNKKSHFENIEETSVVAADVESLVIDIPAPDDVPQPVVPDFKPMPVADFREKSTKDDKPAANVVLDDEEDDDETFGFFHKDTHDSNAVKPADEIVDLIVKAGEVASAQPATDIKPVVADEESHDTDIEVPEHDYILPDVECLAESNSAGDSDVKEELSANANKLVETLRSFNIETKIVDIARGPSVTRYEIQPAPGIKISRIANLSDDIAMNLAASGVRIEAPIPNKAAVGIEIPNRTRLTVSLREIIDSPQFKSATSKLNVALGKDISGNVTCTDLAKMPHLLIAGTTGSGKSVCLNAMIISILFNSTPDEVKLIMIDPKQVEFTVYKDIPHLMVPVVSDPRKAAGALAWAVSEMTKRYKMFSEVGVRDIKGYNKMAAKNPEITPMYQICIFIDELSDLMMVAQNEVEDSICRLAQMARAAGMHLVIATQRPSVNVITGIIKANIPSRIALFVSSQVDSRTIIDTAGAEKLLGNGDMLFNPVGVSKPVRLQGCYVSDEEVERVVDFIKAQGQCEYDSNVMEEIEKQAIAEKKKNDYHVDADASPDSGADEETMRAIAVVVENQLASTTLLQRKLKIGYAKAARIMDELEEKGVIGPFEGSKPRKVLMTKQQYNEMIAFGGSSFVGVDGSEE